MSIFDDMLKSDESLFRDSVALDYDYIPKIVPFRENEQKQVATCIKPLFANRNGKNILLYGPPGVGKTVAIRHILKELEEQTDDIIPVYVNCWNKNSSFKVLIDVCDQLDYKFTHNKKTDELFDVVKNIANKKSIVFCFDEIDKSEEFDFLYMILEGIYRRTVILITNYKSWAIDLDERLKSRLTLEMLEFRKYNPEETRKILLQRMSYAFVDNVWEDDAFELAAKKAAEVGDVRSGLYLLKEAGNAAEEKASRKIRKEHVEIAIKKLDEFNIKKSTDLKDDDRFVLNVIRANTGLKIGDLYEIYRKAGGQQSYKTFQRKIEYLDKNKFISVEKTQGGAEGNTTIVRYERETKLNEY
jgi:archaeal cell division control protein 6